MSSMKKHKTKKTQPPKVTAKPDAKAIDLGFLSSAWFVMLTSAVVGAVLFVVIYGVKVLDPSNEDWLFTYNDITQHYIGWLFYRKSAWQFPIGMIDGLVGDIKVSMLYTDSAPLYALFFKILSPVLPDTFQYVGLIGLFNFILNSSCSSLLIRRFSKSPLFCILGSSLYTVFPPVLQRLFGHETLASHYIIILGFILWAYQDRFRSKKTKYTVIPLLWGLLGILAVGTHMYYLPMIFCALLGSFITDIFIRKEFSRPLFSFSAVTAASLFTMWVFGAFYGKADFSDVGFCETSANLNTFWNAMRVGGHGLTGIHSDSSVFLKELPTDYFQFEGFSYLGLGVIAAFLTALGIVVYCIIAKRCRIFGKDNAALRSKTVWFTAGSIVFALAMAVAVSPKAFFGETVVYDIHYPEKIMSLLATFRASGRFAWVGGYMILTFALYGLSRVKFRSLAAVLLAAVVALQFTDLSVLMKSKRWYKANHPYVSELKDPRWEELAKGCTKLVGLPYDQQEHDIFNLTIFAYRHGMTINHFYIARPDFNAILDQFYRNMEKLQNNSPDPDTLYVFLNKDEIPKEAVDYHVYELDGYYVVKFKGQYDPLAEN